MKILTIVLLAWFGTAHAEVYKWTDKNGRVHYGDRPSDKKAEQITINPGPVNGAPLETQDNQRAIENWLKARDKDREISKQKQAEQAKQKAIRKRKCATMKADLTDMQRGGIAWYDLDKNGERRYFSEEEIQQQISDLKQTIKKYCR